MEDWQQEWQEKLNQTVSEIEEFFHDFGTAAESLVDEVSHSIEDFVEQCQDVLITEVDRCVQDFVDFIAETSQDVESTIYEDWSDFTEDSDFMGISSQAPSSEKNPACIGCCHYHGRVYNNNLLVCGMHPYGWDDDNCPDWESKIGAK